MSDELRILNLEDMPSDAELIERALRRAGLNISFLRVDTRDAFVRALEEFKPDIVLVDFKLPGFSGTEALQIVRSTHPDVPAIIISGSLIDESAIELVHQGAMDYVLKNNLSRLPHAIEHALATERGRRARKAAEREMRDAEEKYHAVFTEARDGIVLVDAQSGLIADCNPEFERQCGRTLEQLRTLHIWELRPPEMQQAAQKNSSKPKRRGVPRQNWVFSKRMAACCPSNSPRHWYRSAVTTTSRASAAISANASRQKRSCGTPTARWRR